MRRATIAIAFVGLVAIFATATEARADGAVGDAMNSLNAAVNRIHSGNGLGNLNGIVIIHDAPPPAPQTGGPAFTPAGGSDPCRNIIDDGLRKQCELLYGSSAH